MAWIKIETSLVRHPKLIHLAELHKIQPRDALGGLVQLWTWCLEYAINGEIEKHKNSMGVICGLETKHLISAGFLDESPLRLHDWKDYIGTYLSIKIKGKKLNALKAKRLRKEKNNVVTTVAPTGGTPEKLSFSANLISSPLSQDTLVEKKPREKRPLDCVIEGWKVVAGIPVEGPESEAWNKVHYPRYAKSAKQLLTLFNNDWGEAVDAMEFVYNHFRDKKLSCTIETVVKHSDLFREFKEGRMVK